MRKIILVVLGCVALAGCGKHDAAGQPATTADANKYWRVHNLEIVYTVPPIQMHVCHVEQYARVYEHDPERQVVYEGTVILPDPSNGKCEGSRYWSRSIQGDISDNDTVIVLEAQYLRAPGYGMYPQSYALTPAFLSAHIAPSVVAFASYAKK